ncbi:MAG: quinol:cytochrome C oxidoreductase [Marinifilaceae bacterium]
MEEKYNFKKRTQQVLYGLMGTGLILFVAGWIFEGIDGHRFWSNVLLNNLLFLFVALFGAAFLALHRISYSGWHTSIQRLPEAFASFLPVAALLMFLLVFGMHDLYHWTHPHEGDAILEGKVPYLNQPFFFVRMFAYFFGWIGLAYLMRRSSLEQDATKEIKYYNRGKLYGALFMVFFAVSSSMMSWDWIMSIDAHWFSTLFGWYVFIGLFVTGVAATILLIAFLKAQGYLAFVNKEHIHDLGKYLFGFSIFWAYLWFSQYLLIWYSHLPEETIYFQTRLNDFNTLFFLNLVLNFLIPFLALMTRNAKRNLKWLSGIAVVVVIGHWLDLYLMIAPGAIGADAAIGTVEIGIALIYFGGFVWWVLRSLAKVPLLAKNDPLLQESFHYES